ncbi:hypothetical protein RYX36_010309, partial [Vicia faba]
SSFLQISERILDSYHNFKSSSNVLCCEKEDRHHEDLIGKLIGHDDISIRCSEMTSFKETREEERIKRDWIPLGRLISDILTENKLIEHLTEAQQANVLEPCAGKPLNAKNLKKMK